MEIADFQIAGWKIADVREQSGNLNLKSEI
jgi:hypothetical protein